MISIITPVYNCEDYLEECINSVLNQTYKDWELILIDDFSTDSSRYLIEKFSKIDYRIRFYFFDRNVGAGETRNKGIEMSKGRYIAFIDSDDYWHRDKLKLQIEFMIKNKIEFSYTYFFELDRNNDPSNIIIAPKQVNSFKLYFNNYIKTLTVIYDTKRIGKIYMPNYRKRQDWGLWFNILQKVNNAYCLKESLAYYRTSNSSLSKNKLNLIKENFNFYRRFFKRNVFESYISMLFFLAVHLPFKVLSKKKYIK